MMNLTPGRELIASFRLGVFTVDGEPKGIALKMLRYDDSLLLTHWTIHQLIVLIASFKEFLRTATTGNVMANNFKLEKLPDGHPVRRHVSESEKVPFTNLEVGDTRSESTVHTSTWSTRGDYLQGKVMFMDGSTDLIVFHEALVRFFMKEIELLPDLLDLGIDSAN